MSIDDIVDNTGLTQASVQSSLAALLRAELIYYKQHVGYCKYAIRPAQLHFNVDAIALVFAVIPCK